MPEMKKFYYDNNTVITPDWLRATAMSRQKIPLIKALRTVSNLGLKEAKDAIEGDCSWTENDICLIDPERTVEYFSKFIGPFPTPEEIASLNIEKNDANETKAIVLGMECICANWQILGFRTKLDGCRTVLENLHARS